MTNKIKSVSIGERGIGFIRLKSGLKITVDIDPEWEPLEIAKHSTNRNLYECTGKGCDHCAKGLPKERYWRIKVHESVPSGKLEQYIDLSHFNFDVFQQICSVIEDIGASNPFTFVCDQYDKGNSYHIKNSAFADPHFVTVESIVSEKSPVKTMTVAKVDKKVDDDDFDFDFDEV